jgi:surface polysaccharide O-acyltransferase-like enzyme
MSDKPNHTEWLNTLRAIATLGVIIIHVSSPLVNMAYGKNMGYWWIGNVVDSSVRFAVPLFLMLTGTTLLGKEYNLSLFYKKRIVRVLFPFLFWMLVYFVFRWTQLAPNNQPVAPFSVVNWGFHLFLKEGVSKHFWYIYMILFIYLFVPLMGKGLRRLSSLQVLYLLLGWVLVVLLLRGIPLNLYGWSKDYGSKIVGYLLHAGYLVLGFYLSRFGVSSVKVRWGAMLLFCLTIIISSFFAFYFSHLSHKVDLTVYSYLNLNTIFQSIAVYILFKDYHTRNRYWITFRNLISSYSFGIYLVHILVIGLFFKFGIFWTMCHPLISLPLVTGMTLLTSIGVIWTLCKLPFGRYFAK